MKQQATTAARRKERRRAIQQVKIKNKNNKMKVK